MNATDIEAQPGAAAGLWTHTPVDWAGNEGGGVSPYWPQNASQGSLGIQDGTRPGGGGLQPQGPAGTVVISAVNVTAIGTTTASITFTLSAAPTGSSVKYGTTQTVTSTAAGTTATQQTVNLSGLTTKTTYYFNVTATNASGTSATNLLTFTTL